MASCIGIDTSNYTTSAALSNDGKILKNVRRLLDVAEGERGLRQSDAVFQHTVNLPSVISELGQVSFSAVGVSDKPRDVEGSYMPCFLSGVAVAESISSLNGVPLYRFSHQAGHIAAALYSCGREDLHHNKLIAFHVSGGTTEVTVFDRGIIKLVGGTKDISAGKAIDRIGVKLGMKFPCGKALESASSDPDAIKVGKLSVDGTYFNLSGLENKADELINKGADASTVAAFTLRHVCAVLEKITENVIKEYGDLPVLYAGGVMSNGYIRRKLTDRFGGMFASPEFSCDNASGIARLTELTLEGVLKYAR